MANSSEDWMQKRWRPAMGWTYMAVCLFDFILGPVLYNILQFYNPGQAVGMWTPLTLQGAGLFHVAMGAVLGIAAFGRTQEKVAGAASNIEPIKPTETSIGFVSTTYTKKPVPGEDKSL